MNTPNIIVIVGPIASGKGTIISHLQQSGYQKISLSDQIRQTFIKKFGAKPNREQLQNLGDQMRKRYGNDYWAKKAGKKIKKNKNFVIDSVRNPEEVIWFRQKFNSFVIGVKVKKKFSVERAISRARDIDPTTDLIGLKKLIQRDLGINQPKHGQQVKKCVALADIKISNNGTFQELEKKLNRVLAKLNLLP